MATPEFVQSYHFPYNQAGQETIEWDLYGKDRHIATIERSYSRLQT